MSGASENAKINSFPAFSQTGSGQLLLLDLLLLRRSSWEWLHSALLGFNGGNLVKLLEGLTTLPDFLELSPFPLIGHLPLW